MPACVFHRDTPIWVYLDAEQEPKAMMHRDQEGIIAYVSQEEAHKAFRKFITPPAFFGRLTSEDLWEVSDMPIHVIIDSSQDKVVIQTLDKETTK